MTQSSDRHQEPEKVPLKANIFEFVQGSNAQLNPLFPYVGPGAIVPCTAFFESEGSETRIGYFLHENAVDEVAMAIASNGRLRTGDVFVGPRKHGVGGDTSEPSFSVMVITQRQLEEGSQPEALCIPCEKCNAILYRYEYDGSEGSEGAFPALPTIAGSAAWAHEINENSALRTCGECGHVNPLFPVSVWGWQNYTRNTRIINRASQAMEEAAS